MRKIISILVALGLVLAGLSAMAVPAGAQECVHIVASNNCSGQGANYTLNFSAPVSLEPVNDQLSVEFPAGTTFGTFLAGDILVDGFAVDLTTLVVDGTKLKFQVPPAAGFITAGNQVTIFIDKVINGPAGDHPICLDYHLDCCDEVVFCCEDYTILPAVSTLGFHFDHGTTYPGIAEDFIPPMKACGQNTTGWLNTTTGYYFNEFDVILRADIVGCAPPCVNASMWFVPTAIPAGEVVTFLWDVGGNHTWYTLTALDVGDKFPLPDIINMPPPPPDLVWPCRIHFSSPGDYEICFYVECPEVVCGPGSAIVAEGCMPVTVYQWKDAWKIDLFPKWNLISLPLFPFDTSVVSVLASLNISDQLMSVWYFDQCTTPDPATGTWYTDPGDGSGNLDDIEAGKSYWIRMMHPGDAGYNATRFPGGLWVFGTHAPMPPADPMAVFDVCEGFNMVGFKAPWSGNVPLGEWDDLYLWNWIDFFDFHYGVIYSWDASVQDWLWNYPTWEWMMPGVGYWIAFDGDGKIYPKP